MLGGVIAGWLIAGREGGSTSTSAGHRPTRRRAWRQDGIFAAVGAAPDLDLLAGTHSTYTHSIGAAALTALAVLLWHRGRQPRLALACAAAVASHILLDWLGSDTTPPIGIMALWPFTREFYQSPFFVFMAITRRWWLPQFYTWNLVAALREVAILGPIALVVGALRRRDRNSECGTRSSD
jgi:LexA-binding, inner membrane-associated putative hydrolase